jgi:hypothetical protein
LLNTLFEIFIPFTPAEFQVTEKAAIIGGYYNQVPVVLYYSFETEKSKILPGLLNENGELTQVRVYPDGTFDVLISARNFKGQQTVWIKNYDLEGNLQSNYALEPEDYKHLIFARSIKTNNNMQLVAGSSVAAILCIRGDCFSQVLIHPACSRSGITTTATLRIFLST